MQVWISPGSPAGEAITACYALLHARTPKFRKMLRERLLNVTLEDLNRVAKQYLVEQKLRRQWLHPFAKREELQQLGFSIQQVN